MEFICVHDICYPGYCYPSHTVFTGAGHSRIALPVYSGHIENISGPDNSALRKTCSSACQVAASKSMNGSHRNLLGLEARIRFPRTSSAPCFHLGCWEVRATRVADLIRPASRPIGNLSQCVRYRILLHLRYLIPTLEPLQTTWAVRLHPVSP